MSLFDLANKRHKIAEITSKTLESDFWNDPNLAQKTMHSLNALKDIVETYDHLHQTLENLMETHNALKTEMDTDLMQLCIQEYQEMEPCFKQYELKLLLSHEYDHFNAIIEIHPGAGGTESCDWCDMLYRMYTRWAEKKGMRIKVLDYLAGDEAGIKSITFSVEGELAYGYLKAEKGVHRLVRISPFDSGARRHTSFASLDVMPQFNDEINVDLNMDDVTFETKRASGAGGQHINKTDSAVRLIHQPTGLVATCQNGRSQHENREEALRILKSRLYQKMIEDQEKKLASIKGVQMANEWGSQIRSYVFHPYSMVKDHRSNYETSNVQAVMDGDLDEFMYAYLKDQL